MREGIDVVASKDMNVKNEIERFPGKDRLKYGEGWGSK
jgi:hypothetical protein